MWYNSATQISTCHAAFTAEKIGEVTIKKGRFEQPRSAKQETDELEQAFLQVTRAANGKMDDSPDQRATATETIVISSKDVQKGQQATKKTPSKAAQTSQKCAASTATAASWNIQRNKKIAIISISVVAAVLVICIGIGIWFYLSSTADDGLILNNVYAAGVNLGGMTPEEAKDALHNATDRTYAQQELVIELPDATLQLSASDTQAALDIDRLVEDAYQYGRGGSRREWAKAKAAAVLSSYTIDLLPYLTLDTDYIQNAIDQLYTQFSSTLTQPSIEIEGNRPTNMTPETVESSEASENDPTKEVYQTLTITMGTPDRTFDADALYDQILDAYNHNEFDPIVVEYTIVEPAKPELESLYKEYCIKPVDAVLDKTDYSISQEVWGYGFNLEDAQALIDEANYGQTVEISLTYIAPAVTKASLEATLFQDTLAEYDTPYYYNPNRTTNLILACQAINGYILKPGETFSFNETLGERTSAKGYQPAGAYVNGETVDQVGGGICQVASTIYYCALYADLEIVERYEHMYSSDYVPLGMDATVNWGTLDFQFRNNTKYPIRIEAYASDGYVHISLIGTDDKSYYVVMDYELIEELHWETVEKEMDADNEKGYKDGDVIQSPYMGYIVDTYKYKYDKETDELISCTYEAHSEYDKRDKLICKIKQEPTVPTTTTPPTTEVPTEAPTEAPTETTPPESSTAETTPETSGQP